MLQDVVSTEAMRSGFIVEGSGTGQAEAMSANALPRMAPTTAPAGTPERSSSRHCVTWIKTRLSLQCRSHQDRASALMVSCEIAFRKCDS
jgi:hypothetical protein